MLEQDYETRVNVMNPDLQILIYFVQDTGMIPERGPQTILLVTFGAKPFGNRCVRSVDTQSSNFTIIGLDFGTRAIEK